MRILSTLLSVALLGAFTACEPLGTPPVIPGGTDGGPPVAEQEDAGTQTDAGTTTDGGTTPADAGIPYSAALTGTLGFTPDVGNSFWYFQGADPIEGTPNLITVLISASPTFVDEYCAKTPYTSSDIGFLQFAPTTGFTGSFPVPSEAAIARATLLSNGDFKDVFESANGSIVVESFDGANLLLTGAFLGGSIANPDTEESGTFNGTFSLPAIEALCP